MAYVGQGIKGGTFSVLDTSGNTYNGSNVTFDLGTHVSSPAQLLVSHDGVIQKPVTDYILASGGTQITFTTAPASGASIFITEISGAVGAPMNRDINGDELILDADADTSITADTDDQIDIRIAGADDFQFTANTFLVQTGSKIDINGTELILDADADTSITADTDDQIDFKIGNTDILKFTNSSSNIRIDAVVSDKDIIFGGNDDGSSTDALTLDMSDNGAATFNDDIYIYDDKGIYFGTGVDFALGANAGETEFVISKGSTTTGGTGGKQNFIPTTDGVYVDLFATEGKGPAHGLYQDDGDDNGDKWRYGQGASDGDANDIIAWAHYGTGSWVHKMRIYTNGNFATSGTHAASQSFDYAEFWEWKTELANDDKITETYGMTVVLDGDKVRLAEAGEEAKVLGVVRPNNTSTMVGGGQEIEYKDKYEKNVWGEIQYEEYTQVTWEDTYNNVTVKHSYMKDRIPAKRIRHGAVKSQENWHTLESNFEKDKDGNTIDLVVPSTSSQKTAANYVERTTYGKDKGEHKAGDKLMRPKLNSSYDFTKSKSYQGRDKRRKEWCVVGLLGQVEVRDSAIVPTSWYKMKNIGTGIDLYYIK